VFRVPNHLRKRATHTHTHTQARTYTLVHVLLLLLFVNILYLLYCRYYYFYGGCLYVFLVRPARAPVRLFIIDVPAAAALVHYNIIKYIII
jgi:hypothetical protein